MEEVKERVVEEVKGGEEENVPRSTKKSRSIGVKSKLVLIV